MAHVGERRPRARAAVRLQAAYRGQKTRNRVVRPALVAFRHIHEKISVECHGNLTIESLCGPIKLPSCLLDDQGVDSGAAGTTVAGPYTRASIGPSGHLNFGSRTSTRRSAAQKKKKAGTSPLTEADNDRAGEAESHRRPPPPLATPTLLVGSLPHASPIAPELAFPDVADGAGVAAVAGGGAAAGASGDAAPNGRQAAIDTAEVDDKQEERKEVKGDEEEEVRDSGAARGGDPVDVGGGGDGGGKNYLSGSQRGKLTKDSTGNGAGQYLPACRQQSTGSSGGEQLAYTDRHDSIGAERDAMRQAEHGSEKPSGRRSTSRAEVKYEMPWAEESAVAEDCFTYSDGGGDGDDDDLATIPAENGTKNSALILQNHDVAADPASLAPPKCEAKTCSAAPHSRRHGGHPPVGELQQSNPLLRVPAGEGAGTATVITRQGEGEGGAWEVVGERKTDRSVDDASVEVEAAETTEAIDDPHESNGSTVVDGGGGSRKVEHERGEECPNSEACVPASRENAATQAKAVGREGILQEEEERGKRQRGSDKWGSKSSGGLLAHAFAACSSPPGDVSYQSGNDEGRGYGLVNSLTWSLASSFDDSPLKGESISALSLAGASEPSELGLRDARADDRRLLVGGKTDVSGEAVSAVPASQGELYRLEGSGKPTASIAEWSSLELEDELDRIREAVGSRVRYLRAIMREPGPMAF